MARKAKNSEEVEEITNVETGEPAEKVQRRRQSPKVRLQFALNNVINEFKDSLDTSAALQAGKQLLEDLGVGLRQSTVVIAGRIQEAMLGLDIMDDLTPKRMKQLGQLLGRAQRGDEITDEQIEDIIGEEFTDHDSDVDVDIENEDSDDEDSDDEDSDDE